MPQNQEELNEYQRMGITRFQLTEKQVRTKNFGQHTLIAMREIKLKRGITDNRVAFNLVKELNPPQSVGVSKFYLTPDDVNTPNFGPHIIRVLHQSPNTTREVDDETHYKRIFNSIKGLNEVQTEGVLEHNFTRAQVETLNFGAHTWTFMNGLIISEERENNRILSREEAYEKVSKLDEYQAQGVFEYRLKKKQVQSPNFGWHTLAAIAFLKDEYGLDNQTAFKRVEGLSNAQIRGVFYFKLAKNQVINTPNFGEHTLKAMRILMVTDATLNYETAFEMVKGLNAAQAEGISEYLLTRNHVENKFYSKKIIDTMKYFHRQIPDADVEGTDLYETAIKLPDFITRGILDCGLTLDQVGIGISQDEFKFQQPKDPNFSGSTVDAVEYLYKNRESEELLGENVDAEMTFQKAYDIAIKLSPLQIRGIIDYGLTLEQVNIPQFIVSGEMILGELIEALKNTIDDDDVGYDFPLSKEQQETVRVVFNEITNQEATGEALVANFARVSISDANDLERLSRTPNSHMAGSLESRRVGDSVDDRKRQAKPSVKH